MEIALVYDKLNTKYGGAEKTLLALHEIWPEAPLYTSYWDKEKADWAEVFEVRTSFLQKLWERFGLNYEQFAWLTPLAFESFIFSDFDMVISVSAEFAKSIVTGPETLHFCYCLTPPRRLWQRDKTGSLVLSPFFSYGRFFDQISAQRADQYIAVSKTVQKRIRKFYKRGAEVIYPPIEIPNDKFQMTNKFQIPNTKNLGKQPESYFLTVNRLVSYKRTDLAIKACNKLRLPLVIVGVGSEEKRLKKLAGGKVEFLGELTEEELMGYYQKCRAILAPQEEDFGLVAVEGQSFGKPVIAFGQGGARETVKDGQTGVLFWEQSVESLIRAIKIFEKKEREGLFQAKRISGWADNFNKNIFKKEFREYVEKNYALRLF